MNWAKTIHSKLQKNVGFLLLFFFHSFISHFVVAEKRYLLIYTVVPPTCVRLVGRPSCSNLTVCINHRQPHEASISEACLQCPEGSALAFLQSVLLVQAAAWQHDDQTPDHPKPCWSKRLHFSNSNEDGRTFSWHRQRWHYDIGQRCSGRLWWW